MVREEENKKKLADEYRDEARRALAENRLKDALKLEQKSSYLYQEAADQMEYTFSMNMLGVIYAAMGNENAAIDYYLEALELALKYKCSQALPLIYNNIGTRYQQLGANERATEYFQRAVDMLKTPACQGEERYILWNQVSYLNLAKAYMEERKYDTAWEKIEEAKKFTIKESNPYYYSYLIVECRLYWRTGEREEVYQHIDEILKYAEMNENVFDYEEDMKDICALFCDMEEYDNWKFVIASFEERVKNLDNIHFRLLINESWMDYCQAIGDKKCYEKLCIEHTALYREQKRETDIERASAIDMKVALREMEFKRKNAEKKSHIDALTSLGNRYLLEKDIKKLLALKERENTDVTVGVLDIDCFKAHNDTYGHIEGDRCLQAVAAIVAEAVQEVKGYAYRFGGDEFVILLDGGEEERIIHLAEQIKTKVCEASASGEVFAEGAVTTVSQGYAVISGEREIDQKDLIAAADKALYYVKNHGKNGYHIIKGQEFKD